MQTKDYSYDSASGICPIKAWQWSPDDGKVKAVIQFHHGMAEHSARYYGTIKALTDLGYVVFMNDMLGHGQSNIDKSLLGYFGDKNGDKNILEDTHTLTQIARTEYPDVPIILIGHSMGSFVMRCYFNEYKEDIAAAVFIGTSGDNPLTKISIAITNALAAIQGKKKRSHFLANLSSKGYNDRNDNLTPFDWLSTDKNEVAKYIDDKLCGFDFTIQGYQDLAHLVIDCSDDKWYANMPQKMPVLLLTGADDPVGAYGEGVKQVYDKLKGTGHDHTQIIIYPGYRHEVLNEPCKEQVIKDIDDFITAAIKAEVTV